MRAHKDTELTGLIWLAAAGLVAAGLLATTARAEPGEEDPPPPPCAEPLAGPVEEAPPPPCAEPVAGPPVGDVVSAAYRAAGLDRSPARGWIRRARVAGLIPQVTVRTGSNTSWQELDPEIDRGTTIEVRATWRLDRVLFDGRELQIASIEATRRRERRQLSSRVIRSYFHWQRMASAAASDPRWASRAEEAAAELDALTDGWFSGRLATPARRRTPGTPP